jgi:hypothetical protein
MTTPSPHQPDHEPVSKGQPDLADLINIRDWLAAQDDHIAQTPPEQVQWLHQQIAAAASGLAVGRAARLADIDEFRTLFAARLDQAITAGWDTNRLHGVELFQRYAHDDAFRDRLHTAAGLAAYTAVRADPSLPADEFQAAATVPARRQRILIKAIEDHAARYAAPHNPIGGLNPARYVAEAHVPGGASRTEWDWIAYYIAAHPEVLRRPPLPLAELERRDRAAADDLLNRAGAAFDAGDMPRALALIDQAELYQPHRDWDGYREIIRTHAAATDSSPADPGTYVHDATAPQRHPTADGDAPAVASAAPGAALAFPRPPLRQPDPPAHHPAPMTNNPAAPDARQKGARR